MRLFRFLEGVGDEAWPWWLRLSRVLAFPLFIVVLLCLLVIVAPLYPFMMLWEYVKNGKSL